MVVPTCFGIILPSSGSVSRDRRGEWSAPGPGRFTPGKDSLSIVQEPGWASGPVWTCEKKPAPTGGDPRTVQPVISRYTDWATRPTLDILRMKNKGYFKGPKASP
jgi:hypothetical protein